VDSNGLPASYKYSEFTQHFPRPGWVEHDATEIWNCVQQTLNDLLESLPAGTAVAAIGITNQRETVVAWDRNTGQPLAKAIVWQDRRTADGTSRQYVHVRV
jgi:glycerol kinase